MKIRALLTTGWMHNLTVDNLHTYYVLAGTTPVLVHNEGGVPVSPFVDGQDFEWSIQNAEGKCEWA